MALLTNINGKFSVSDVGAVTFNNAFTFPTADGAANYVLQTNGSGQLAWALNGNGDISGSGTANTVTKFTGAKTIGNGPITFSGNNSTFAGTIDSGAITSTGKITGTELEGTSLDINGTAYIDGLLDVNSGAANTVAIFESTDDKAFIRIKDDDTDTYLISRNNKFSIGESSSDYDNFKVDISTGDATFAGNVTTGSSLISSNIIINQITSGTTNGNINLRNNAGSNIVVFNNDLSTTFAGTVTAPTFLGDLNGTINTVTTATTKGNSTNDTTVATTAFVQNVIGTIPAGLVFQGTWNAATNSPTLTSGSGTTGNFYIVSVAGSTNLDGITDWQVGDWAVFIEQGASDQWEKIDNSSVLSGSGIGGSFAGWSGSGTSVTLGNAPVTFSGNNSTFAGSVTSGDYRSPSGDTLYITSGLDWRFRTTGGAERMRIDSSGIVKINTTAVNARFRVDEGRTGEWVAGFKHTGTTPYGVFIDTSGNTSTGYTLGCYTNTGTGLFVKNDGKVGIGTTSPAQKLHVGDGGIRVEKSATGLGGFISVGNATESTGNYSAYFFGNTASDTSYFKGGIAYETLASTYGRGDMHFLQNSTTAVANVTISDSVMTILNGGNVGIGTTNPGSKLTINETSTATAAVNIVTARYGISLQGAGATSNSQYLLNLQSDGGAKEVMRVQSSGNVGIGTTDPDYTLHLLKSSGDTEMYINGQNGQSSLRMGLDARNWQIKTAAAPYLWSLNYVGTDVPLSNIITANVGGNVGIGTNLPDSKLDVKGASATPADGNQTLSITNTTGGTQLNIGTAENSYGWIEAREGATLRNLLLNPNGGNVGIGTTSNINAPLTVQADGGAGTINLIGRSNGVYDESIISFYENDGTTRKGYILNSAGNMYFATGGSSENMVIDSSGNVGIGNTSPSAFLSWQKQLVVGSGSADAGITIYHGSGSGNQGAIVFADGNTGTDRYRGSISYTGADEMRFFTSTAERMLIDSSGVISIGPSTTSSEIYFNYNNTNNKGGLKIDYSTAELRLSAGESGNGYHQAFYTNGSERMRIDSSGNVMLDVNNWLQGHITVGGGTQSLIRSRAMGYPGYYGCQVGEENNHIALFIDPLSVAGGSFSGNISELMLPNYVLFKQANAVTSPTNWLGPTLALSDGNVGIGTISPGAKLDVNGATYVRSVIYGYAGGGNQYGGLSWSGTDEGFLFLKDSNVTKVNINSNGNSYLNGGNVGIGTTNPGTLHGASYGTTRLQIDGGTDRGQLIIEGDSFAGIVLSDNGATANQRVFATSVDDTKYTIKPLNDNGTSTAQGVAVTVLHGGNVGIGDTSPDYRLSVKKVNAATPAITVSGAFYGGPRIQTYGLDADPNAWMGLGTDMAGLAYEHSIYFSNKASTGQGVLTIGSYNGTTYSTKMAVWNNGNIGIGTGTSTVSYKLDVTGTIRATGDVIAYSDRRVKENIKTIDNALSKVLKLRGVSYNRKDIDDKSTKIGVIAQEVLETIPEVVEKDLEGKYSVAYGNMAGLFIEAIKELKAEIEELKLNKCNCNK